LGVQLKKESFVFLFLVCFFLKEGSVDLVIHDLVHLKAASISPLTQHFQAQRSALRGLLPLP